MTDRRKIKEKMIRDYVKCSKHDLFGEMGDDFVDDPNEELCCQKESIMSKIKNKIKSIKKDLKELFSSSYHIGEAKAPKYGKKVDFDEVFKEVEKDRKDGTLKDKVLGDSKFYYEEKDGKIIKKPRN